MPHYAWVQNNHGSNTYTVYPENNPFNVGPSESWEGWVNDEAMDTFRANLVGQPSCVLREKQVDYGEQARLGRTDLSVSGTIAEVASTDLANVTDVYLTSTGVGTLINGLGGGYDGRVVRLRNKTTNALNTLSLGHLAGGSTPSTSRLFTNGLGTLLLGRGAVVEATYHGGDGLWYVG